MVHVLFDEGGYQLYHFLGLDRLTRETIKDWLELLFLLELLLAVALALDLQIELF